MTAKLNEKIKQKILDFLKDKKIGASSSEIAKALKHNRITISKYLEIMNALNILNYKTIAQAKIWSINKSELKKKILVVDDEPHIVSLIKLTLKPDTFNIFEAYNGYEALKIAELNKPDLIILDLMMPDLDGFEVCKRIRNNPALKDIKILILSAKSEIENKFKGIDLGADNYMTKPFDPEELERVIENMLFPPKSSEVNKITGLPTRGQFKKYAKNNKNGKIFEIRIKNFELYKKRFGIESRDKLLKLISRMLQDKIKDDLSSFIVQKENSVFIIATKLGNIEKEIKTSFERMLPYIYHNKKCDKKVNIEIKEIKL